MLDASGFRKAMHNRWLHRIVMREAQNYVRYFYFKSGQYLHRADAGLPQLASSRRWLT